MTGAAGEGRVGAGPRPRVLVVGVGGVGRGVVRLLRRRGYPIAGAVDVDPRLAGRDLGEAVGEAPLGVPVVAEAGAVVRPGVAEVAIHATGWVRLDFDELAAQLHPLVRAGLHVISVAGIFDPTREAPGFARDLDALARTHGVTVLGIGLNPGLLFDVLPLLLSGACQEVRRVHAARGIDCSGWSPGLLRRYGIGLGAAEFRAEVAAGRVPLHATMEQSVSLLAYGLGWRLDAVRHTREPLVARTARRGAHGPIAPGRVAGFRHLTQGYRDGDEALRLELAGAVAPQPAEDGFVVGTRIALEGTPGLTVEIGGEILSAEGTYAATVARPVNAIPYVLRAPRGFVRLPDLPVIAAA